MKKHFILILGLALILTTASIFLIYRTNNAADNNKIPVGTEIGQKAPDFTLQNLSDKKVSLSEFQGKKVFLNFWATWCPPCRLEMPAIQKLYNNYREEVAIIGINVGQDKGKVMDFMLARSYNFRILLDKKTRISNRYLVNGIPTTYILDEKGIIRKKHVGTLTYEQMLELLELNN